jgi:ABC-type antimicrobial peptide transport system permease subunit
LLGRRIIMGSQGGGQAMEVIGVVGDVRTQSLAATSEVEFYRPVMQRQRQVMTMLVRTVADPAAFESTARQVLAGVDATLPLTGITTHLRMIEQSLAQQRLLFVMLTVFAVLAVVLSSVGIYGVVSAFVGQRTPEIGVRVALGASRAQVIRIVVGQSLVPVGAGLFVMSSGVVVLALAAGAACAIPAARAARIDPIAALRSD